MPAFRFGVQLNAASSGRDWIQLTRRAEELGFSTFMVPDHFDSQLSPISALAYAAATTNMINLGTLVMSNDYRHPLVLAREAATLASLSGGRLELGIGAGWMKSDYEQSGLLFDPPGRRISRLVESIEVMKALWDGGPVDYQGEFYSLAAATSYPEVPLSERPRLTIGGGGRRVLDVAARYADVVGINPNLAAGKIGTDLLDEVTPDKFDERVAHVRESLDKYGREAELQCLTFMSAVVDDSKGWIESMSTAFGVDPDVASAVPIILYGSIEQIIDQIERRRERYGFSYWVVHQHEMESFAPVVGALTGR